MIALNVPAGDYLLDNMDLGITGGVDTEVDTDSDTGADSDTAQPLVINLPDNLMPQFVSLGANELLKINDRTEVNNYVTSITSAGSDGVNLGVDSVVRDVVSLGNVFMRDRALVVGDVKTAGLLTVQDNYTVTGEVVESASVVPFNELVLNPGYFDAINGDVSIEPNLSESLDPGSYGALSVKTDSEVILSTGLYEFNSLSVEPGAGIVIDDVNGPVIVMVKSGFTFRGTVSTSLGDGQPNWFIGYTGTEMLSLESSFNGTIMAPLAKINMASIASPGFTGSFFAKEIEVHQGAVVNFYPFNGWDSVCGNIVTGNCMPAPVCDYLSGWEIKTYSSGNRVTHNGQAFECKEGAASGWCGLNYAYEPGSGAAWADAWTLLGDCKEPFIPKCSNLSLWSLGEYNSEDRVENFEGEIYECRPWPYSGWCGAADAYEPGVGWAWKDAWIKVADCEGQQEVNLDFYSGKFIPIWMEREYVANELVRIGTKVYRCLPGQEPLCAVTNPESTEVALNDESIWNPSKLFYNTAYAADGSSVWGYVGNASTPSGEALNISEGDQLDTGSYAILNHEYKPSVAVSDKYTVMGYPKGASDSDEESGNGTVIIYDNSTGEQYILNGSSYNKENNYIEDNLYVQDFGASVAVSGDTVVVGAPSSMFGTWQRAGAYIVYKKNDSGDWLPYGNPVLGYGGSQSLGRSVAIEGDTVIAGLCSVYYGTNGLLAKSGTIDDGNVVTTNIDMSDGDISGFAYAQYCSQVDISGGTVVIGSADNNLG
ncbi:MAG: hypothetical protein JXR91_05400, partial [Deltaproteobacteria bacterium]|nr:hypothetical protein [Deltaproteobacteria bacterium]